MTDRTGEDAIVRDINGGKVHDGIGNDETLADNGLLSFNAQF